MPPKRALEQVDANIHSKRDAKQQKLDESAKGTEKHQQAEVEPDPNAEVYLLFDT